MPRKEQGWIAFQFSEKERQILEQICQRREKFGATDQAPSIPPSLPESPRCST